MKKSRRDTPRQLGSLDSGPLSDGLLMHSIADGPPDGKENDE